MHTIARPISAHRLARLAAWAQAMLAWLAAMLFSDRSASRRRLRRYRMLDLMPRFVECLLVIRAARGARRSAQPTRPANAPAGFARTRHTRAQILRAAIGARMRRRLRPPSLRARLAILCDALNNLDAYASHLIRRRRRRLTRLNAIIPTRPPHESACAIAAPLAPQPADSS